MSPIAAPRPPAWNCCPSLDEVEPCDSLPDYHALPARLVIGVVLRSYLDPLFLTPTELIHLAKPLKACLEQGTLIEAALAAPGQLPGDPLPLRGHATARHGSAPAPAAAFRWWSWRWSSACSGC